MPQDSTDSQVGRSTPEKYEEPAENAGRIVCGKCGARFVPRNGKPLLYCQGCIDSMFKPNKVATAYQKSGADANKAHREGLPWGYRESAEEKIEREMKKRKHREGA